MYVRTEERRVTHTVDGSDARLRGEDSFIQAWLHSGDPGVQRIKENSGEAII